MITDAMRAAADTFHAAMLVAMEVHGDELFDNPSRMQDVAMCAVSNLEEPFRTQVITAMTDRAHADAAVRIFDTLTQWLKADPHGSYFTRMNGSGRVELVLNEIGRGVTAERAAHTFYGETIQDAYAQAAQAIQFEREE